MADSPARILIVEDEQVVAFDIQCDLEQMGYQVVGTVRSGAAACELAVESSPDLILMDVRIDGPMDGIETARRIRQSRDVPVVFLTAYTDEATLNRAKETGPYGYLVKPFAERELQASIEVALYKGALDRRQRESHQNLQAILNAKRHGTIMLDSEHRVRFASRTIRCWATVSEDAVHGAPLQDVLPLSDGDATALSDMCHRQAGKRSKLALALATSQESGHRLEIEIVDDPRDDGGRILFVYDQSSPRDSQHPQEGRAVFHNMLGKSKAMCQVFQDVEQLGRVDSTVLIEGETGTGKELVARAIHRLSARCDGPFLALNCGGLSEDLAASQLFGHRRGSFTGAVDDQVGLFEAASGGILFLDEIGELPLRVQTSLLRVLEDNAVLRLGESEVRPVNIRIVAATHRDLAEEAIKERFRQDLLYRIRIARIRLPALRDRRDDLPLLVEAFLAEHRASTGKQVNSVSDEAMVVLFDYGWPGNVRELRNVLEYAVVRCQDAVIQPVDLPHELLGDYPTTGSEKLGNDENDRILAALKWAKGNRTRAATLLGVSRATLYRRLKELGLEDA